MSTTSSAIRQQSREPLAGIKVLDFTHVLAGPFCTRLLADFGADVVRIETAKRPDRLGAGTWKPGFEDKQDRPAAYLSSNRNKRAMAVDLKTEAGRTVALDLAAQADVVIENFSGGVMERLGLGYEVMSRSNPGLIFISMAGFGQTGPRRDWTSMNMNLQACSGLMMATGEDGEPPIAISNSWNDYVGGLHACFLVLEMLGRRRVTQKGRYIDLSQFECSVSSLGTLVVESAATGRAPCRIGNRSRHAAPQGCYRCAGEDEWCAIVVRSDEQWRRLADLAGLARWALDANIVTLSSRQAHHDEIDRKLETWTRTLSPDAIEACLHASGIPVQKMLRVQDLIDRPRDDSPFRLMQEPRIGEMMVTTLPFSMSFGEPAPLRPAPSLGEHTNEVLREWLGETSEGIAQLHRTGALS